MQSAAENVAASLNFDEAPRSPNGCADQARRSAATKLIESRQTRIRGFLVQPYCYPPPDDPFLSVRFTGWLNSIYRPIGQRKHDTRCKS